MPEIRGNRFGLSRTPEEILAIMEEVASQYGLDSHQVRRYFFRDWKTLSQIKLLSLGSIRQFLGALRRDPHLATYQSRCGADYFRLKNHYLGFYLEENTVIKVFLDSDALTQHVQGVQRFNELKRQYLRAPELIRYSQSPYPHTRERYIAGKNFQLLPLDLPAGLIEELADFHLHQPGELEEKISDTDKAMIIENLQKIGLESKQLDKIQTFFQADSWKVLVGETHGDLNRGNLIKGADAIYLTDWEFYSRKPVAQDLVKLYSQADETLRNIILNVYQEKLEEIESMGDTCSFLSSLLLYTLKTLLFLDQDSKKQLELVFQDQTLVNRKIAVYQQILLDSIMSLLEAAENR